MNSRRTRIAVFIDYQNCYNAARRAFHQPSDPSTCGHFWPHRMADVLAGQSRSDPCDVVFTGVYCGIADPRKAAQTARARQRQVQEWQARGASVFTRPLRYPRFWPRTPAQEKGVDVKLAIDVVMRAVEGMYDVAILASCDTDLAPAIEALLELEGLRGRPAVELLGWVGPGRYRITVPRRKLTYRWIGMKDYPTIQDLTDYTVQRRVSRERRCA